MIDGKELERISKIFEVEFAKIFVGMLEDVGKSSRPWGSPIEMMLALSFKVVTVTGSAIFPWRLWWWDDASGPNRFKVGLDEFVRVAGDVPWSVPAGPAIHVAPQVQVGFSRLDFLAICRLRGELIMLGIECDGHEFHEKTKEQAARDKARDRELLGRGIPVMRFAGSEIWANPMKCASQVDMYFYEVMYRKSDEANRGA